MHKKEAIGIWHSANRNKINVSYYKS